MNIPSDDLRLRPRRIYAALTAARSRVLADAIERGYVSDFNYTTLPCVPLEETTAHECGCIPANGCAYLKTSCELAHTIGDNSSMIRDVTGLDLRWTDQEPIIFSKTDWDRIKYHKYDKYTATRPRYFIRNNRLFFVVPDSLKRLKTVTVRMLTDDPVTVQQDCNFCTQDVQTDCTSALDYDFPLDQKYLFRVIELTRYELFYGEKSQVPNQENPAQAAREG